MSGGHYNYAYNRINEFAKELELCVGRFDSNGEPVLEPKISKHRVEFRKLLLLIADAAQALEWADSGDSDEDEAVKAMQKVFQFRRKK